MQKVLITGTTGFVGKHLANYLLAKGTYELIGTYHSESSLQKIAEIKDRLILKQIDLTNPEETNTIISDIKPDFIVHLAAYSSPQMSYENPSATLTNNILSELSILEALKKNNLTETRFLLISTAEIYGLIQPTELPVDELTPMRPISPYAVSKIAQDYLGLQSYLSNHLKVIRVRPFNHIGPGQNNMFVIASFCQQIAEIEKDKREPVINVGNLDAKRDFTDVRDIVKAYELVMTKGIPGDVYNIGSGKSYKVGDLLQKLLSFSKKQIEVKVDPQRMRSSDIPDYYCDYSKLASLTGWEPKISVDETLQETLDYWRLIV